MRKYLVFLAAAASAVAIAAPASAQYYGGSPAYGYNGYGYNGYGSGDYGRSYNRYGYGNYGAGYESDRLIAANRERMAKIHGEIRAAAMSGRLSPGEAASLDRRAAQFDRELALAARGGMTGQEGAIFDARADRLAQEVQARTGYGYGNRYGYGYDNNYGYGYGYDR